VLTGEVKGLLLLDVTPLSLGIETYGGVFTKIIDRNTTIPTKKSQVFSTAADMQTSVEVHVLQGEREMAQYNKTLGKFTLSGIPPAPRGVPQIEVTYDIDANGIVHVAAKDLGTNNEQKITITASTNLTDAEIDKAVKEAEQFASDDKKKKEEVEIRNNADSMVYQSEKTLKDVGDKLSSDDKAKIEAEIAKVKTALQGSDTELIKKANDELTQAFYEVSAKIYQQNPPADSATGSQEGTGEQGGGTGADGAYEADYKVVDEDEKK
jgi:molecular chaperone DnaK